MTKSLYAIILILVASLGATAQNWELIYHNDKEGKPVSGTTESLIEAIRAGEEIRVAWWFQHPSQPKIKVEHIADAQFLTIMSDSIVFAQIEPIAGQTPDFNEATITLKENLEWRMVAGTNGTMDRLTRNTISGEIVEHKPAAYAFKWFVKRD